MQNMRHQTVLRVCVMMLRVCVQAVASARPADKALAEQMLRDAVARVGAEGWQKWVKLLNSDLVPQSP